MLGKSQVKRRQGNPNCPCLSLLETLLTENLKLTSTASTSSIDFNTKDIDPATLGVGCAPHECGRLQKAGAPTIGLRPAFLPTLLGPDPWLTLRLMRPHWESLQSPSPLLLSSCDPRVRNTSRAIAALICVSMRWRLAPSTFASVAIVGGTSKIL
jgi:hypothetical protein